MFKKISFFALFLSMFFLNLDIVKADTYNIDTSYYSDIYEQFFDLYPEWTNQKYIDNLCQTKSSSFATNLNYYFCSFYLIEQNNYGVLINGKKYAPVLKIQKYEFPTMLYAIDTFTDSGYIQYNYSFRGNLGNSCKTQRIKYKPDGSYMGSDESSYSCTLYDRYNFDESSRKFYNLFNYQTFSNIVSTNMSSYFEYDSSSNKTNSISIKNSLYGYDNPVNLSFDELWPDSFHNYFTFSSYDPIHRGTFKTDKFAYFIKDFELGNNKEIEFNFTFSGKVSREDFDVYYLYNDNYINGGGTCEFIDNSYTNCHFKYKYNVNNNRGISLFFKFKNSLSFNFFDNDSNNINSAFEVTSDNIKKYSVYRTLDLTQFPGVVFYLNDYRVLDFIPLDYNFRFLSTDSILGLINVNSGASKKVFYSSTYLYFNEEYSSFQVPGNSSYLPMGSVSDFLLSFSFDSNSDKFQALSIKNDNVRSNDTDVSDRPSFKIEYNASIFAYSLNKIMYIVSEDGEELEENLGFHTGSNIHTIDKDGNNISHIVTDTDVPYETFIDVNIEAYYKNSLEFFKDKFISFFDLINNFYDSLSIKIKYFFTLLFMLVIGLILSKFFL